MIIGINVGSMREAERLSRVCNQFPYEMYLRAKKFCADPKSTLGVLAMMYADRDNMTIDTGDMPDEVIMDFSEALSDYIKPVAVESAL